MFKIKMTEIRVLDKEYSWKSMTLLEFLEEGNVPTGWADFFAGSEVWEELKIISDKLAKETRTIYPSIQHVFRALYLTAPEQIKVIIIGQDCYPNHPNNSAVGICFSVKKGNTINPSLRNIYAELKREAYKITEDGSLFHWSQQGCLMLNASLTVAKGSANSHKGIWVNFYEMLVKYVVEKVKQACWLLMGRSAQEIKEGIPNNHKVFCSSHPSPYSFKESFAGSPAFYGSDIFQRTNITLRNWGKDQIKW